MATLEQATAAGVGIIGLVAGYFLSQIITKNNLRKNISQKIKESELRRWKIDKEYSSLLQEKNPQITAKTELLKLNKLLSEIKGEKKTLNSETENALTEIGEIRNKINNEKTPLNQLIIREISLSGIMAELASLRQKAENCNNLTIYHGYNERFLNFVAKGMRKPGIVDVMDKVAGGIEIENPYTQNVDLILSQIEGMTNDGKATMDKFKTILALD
jgi:hypothetical protein